MNQKCTVVGHGQSPVEYICIQSKPIQWACEKCYKENKQQINFQSIKNFQQCLQQAKQIVSEQTDNGKIEQMKFEFDIQLQKIKEIIEFYLNGIEYQMNSQYEDLGNIIKFIDNFNSRYLESPNPDHYQYLQLINNQNLAKKFDQFQIQTNQFMKKFTIMQMDMNEQIEVLSESIILNHLEKLIKRYDLSLQFVKQIETLSIPKQFYSIENYNTQFVVKDNIEGNICYIGQLENEQFHGKGLLFIESQGMAYYGAFTNGLFCFGIALNLNKKELFLGEFEFLDLFVYRITNYGKYLNSDCEEYEGDFSNGVFNGYGQFQYKNGDLYKGQWKDGKCFGQGEIQNKEFGLIKGNFINGKLNGKGELESSSKRYIGDFVDSEMDGQGTLEDLIDQTKYVGQFKKGLKWGKGTLTFQNNRKIEGNFENNQPYGICVETINKKFYDNLKQVVEVIVEQGEYINGQKCGQFSCEITSNGKSIKKIKYYDQGNTIFEDVID